MELDAHVTPTQPNSVLLGPAGVGVCQTVRVDKMCLSGMFLPQKRPASITTRPPGPHSTRGTPEPTAHCVSVGFHHSRGHVCSE